ncbi:FHA domain-containing protein [Schlesneria paludicola]|uniref:FHA domain-containing protein n=1 Tax=Schlesneria paludicola TaxID=360056 RepID=UPI00029AE295|nr:FHA domain-containing protein [Schlesneria paludicola]
MPAFLVPVDANQSLIPLEKAIVLIGRQSDCDVSLTNSRKISRKHCCIAQVNETLIIRDLGSTNGVFLNGNRVEKEAMITVGDEITIGDIHFTLRSEIPATAKAGGAKNGKGTEKPNASPRGVPPIPPPVPAASRKPLLIPSSAELNLKFDEESSDEQPTTPRPRRS